METRDSSATSSGSEAKKAQYRPQSSGSEGVRGVRGGDVDVLLLVTQDGEMSSPRSAVAGELFQSRRRLASEKKRKKKEKAAAGREIRSFY